MRNPIKRNVPSGDRLAQLADEARRRAEGAPPGVQREALLKAARLGETGLAHSQLDEFASPEGAEVMARVTRLATFFMSSDDRAKEAIQQRWPQI